MLQASGLSQESHRPTPHLLFHNVLSVASCSDLETAETARQARGQHTRQAALLQPAPSLAHMQVTGHSRGLVRKRKQVEIAGMRGGGRGGGGGGQGAGRRDRPKRNQLLWSPLRRAGFGGLGLLPADAAPAGGLDAPRPLPPAGLPPPLLLLPRPALQCHTSVLLKL